MESLLYVLIGIGLAGGGFLAKVGFDYITKRKNNNPCPDYAHPYLENGKVADKVFAQHETIINHLSEQTSVLKGIHESQLKLFDKFQNFSVDFAVHKDRMERGEQR